jgi:cellulose synthase/poly-beta-1,6-N-acetylglucosamine synthase-like glycosyltransferase
MPAGAPMTTAGVLVVALYFLSLSVLAVYGCHRYYLLSLYRRHGAHRPGTVARLDPLPRVTVQLPIYNELYVVERLIRAACALDYPADRLEIQVLDDSDDETTALAARVVAEMAGQGHDVVHVRRAGRAGFKAGALAHGLALARGDFLAIFDADFLPRPGFLLDLIHHFSHPRVGMVQARWGHLNRDYSLLTRLQSIYLDGHFVIEHAARDRAGRFFNFNGTAGIWRRSCIESAGGWRADTLTEDLDLSYRAQLKGWRFVFRPDVVAPGELPADLDAFRSQQRRWARGSIETARAILPRLLRARLPLGVKIESLFHLTNNASYVLMVMLAILMIPAMILRRHAGLRGLLLLDLPLVLMSTASVSTFYLRARRETGGRRLATVRLLPFLMSLGIGLALNNARAVLAVFGARRSEFVRTPKHDLRGSAGTWRRRYRAPSVRGWTVVELLFALSFTLAVPAAIRAGLYASVPILLLFQSGFLFTSILSLFQSMPRKD